MEETSAYKIFVETPEGHRRHGLSLDYIRNTLRPGILIVFKNPFPTSQRIHCFSVTKTNLMFCSEILAVYSENHTEHTNSIGGKNREFS
jgi:hypothetical protein